MIPIPRISADTVAEHRANQERHLLDVAHAILEETGDVPSMSEVAGRADIARSSMYHYFSSREALLNALIQDTFPKWAECITGSMSSADTPAQRILAYALTNLDLVHEGAHAVGSALAALSPGEALNEQVTRMHRAVQEPLVATLTELDVADPEAMSELINAVVHASTRLLEMGRPIAEVRAHLTTFIAPMADSLAAEAEIKAAAEPATGTAR